MMHGPLVRWGKDFYGNGAGFPWWDSRDSPNSPDQQVFLAKDLQIQDESGLDPHAPKSALIYCCCPLTIVLYRMLPESCRNTRRG